MNLKNILKALAGAAIMGAAGYSVYRVYKFGEKEDVLEKKKDEPVKEKPSEGVEIISLEK